MLRKIAIVIFTLGLVVATVRYFSPGQLVEDNSSGETVAINNAEPSFNASTAPKEHRETIDRLSRKQAIELNRLNTPFLSGLATGLVQRCSAPDRLSDRLALQKWAAAGLSSHLFGTDYSNPDLGKSVGNMAAGNVMMAAGTRFSRDIPCGQIANSIASGILASVRQMEGRNESGETIFVSTCSHRHGSQKCECLAGVLRGTMPEIHRRPYSGRLIQDSIKRNPMTGFMAMACGVSNY